jgi:protein-ribulosamine 3-kinase
MTDWEIITSAISDATRRKFNIHGSNPVGGGSINDAYRIEGRDGARYFVKLNDARHLPMFAAEAEGLEALAATNTIRVPRAFAHGSAGRQSYLVLEYLEMNGRGNAGLLGEQLAAMHHCIRDQYGFADDNFIGSTPQPNGWHDDWIDFWRQRRLGFQLQLAESNGYGGQLRRLGERLMEKLPAIFDGYLPQPSLLHGDLWGGNHGFLQDGTPAIFDPAAYYGDRECDLAMTELFGGYSGDFYAAYRSVYPLDAGYTVRKELYNLYHILNHANLFGGGYAGQAEHMMQRLLASAS